MASVEVRSRRSPFCPSVSWAPPVRVRLATVALAERFTDLPVTVTKSPAAGTPLGLQLEAVDQFPPDVGPHQVLLAQLPSLRNTRTLEPVLTATPARPSRLKSATAIPPGNPSSENERGA